ncbi:Polycystin-1 [Nymphon striatum]|nr:Polycystin-1 [Nymphon striatum]
MLQLPLERVATTGKTTEAATTVMPGSTTKSATTLAQASTAEETTDAATTTAPGSTTWGTTLSASTDATATTETGTTKLYITAGETTEAATVLMPGSTLEGTLESATTSAGETTELVVTFGSSTEATSIEATTFTVGPDLLSTISSFLPPVEKIGNVFHLEVYITTINGELADFQNLSPATISSLKDTICEALAPESCFLDGIQAGSIIMSMILCYGENSSMNLLKLTNELEKEIQNFPFDVDISKSIVEAYVGKDGEEKPYKCPNGIEAAPITSIRITTPKMVVVTDKSVPFRVSLSSGTNVTCTMDFGDSTNETQSPIHELSHIFPFIFKHTFATEGNFDVQVQCWNDLTVISSNITIKTILSVPEPLVFSNSPVPVPDGIVSIYLYLSEPKETKYKTFSEWDFGDDTQLNATYLPKAGVALNMTHEYSSGTYSVSIRLSNEISEYSLSLIIIAINSADNATLSTEKKENEFGKPVFFHFNSPRALNGTLEMDFGDGHHGTKKISNEDEPFVENIVHTYDQTGNFSVSAIFYNEVRTRKMELPHEIIIQKAIESVNLIVPDVIVVPPNVTKFEISHNGLDIASDVKCNWVIDGKLYASTKYEEFGESSANQSIDVMHKESGSHYVFVHCSNLISSNGIGIAFTVVKSIIEFTADVKTDVAVDEKIFISLKIDAGDDVMFTTIFGDGTAESKNGTDLSGVFEHSFDYPDFFNVLFIAENSVSKLEIRKIVYVLEPITGLQITAMYRKTLISSELINGEGFDQNIFPMDRSVCFSVSVETGNNIVLSWEIEGKIIETTEFEYCHKFMAEGFKTLRLTASNNMYESKGDMTVLILEPLRISTVESDAPRKVNETISFNLKLWKNTMHPCLVWDMGDNSPYFVFFEEYSDCSNLLHVFNNTRGYILETWTPSEHMSHQYSYQSERTFTVEITTSNPVSITSFSIPISVLAIPCRYPKVSFNAYGNTIEVARIIKSSETLNMEAIVITDCGLNRDAWYKWTAMKVNLTKDGQFHSLEPYAISQLDVSGEVFLQRISFGPRTFEASSYFRISLEVGMKNFTNISTIAHQFILSLPSPIVLQFETEARISYGSNIVLDLTSSYDPDDGKNAEKDDWFVEIWCSLENEALKENDILILDGDERRALDGEYLGGCFGTGPGRLVTLDEQFYINFTSEGMSPNKTYIFKAIATTEDGKHADVTRSVELVIGNPPHVSIKILEEYSKVPASYNSTFIVDCAECPHPDYVEYTWHLSLLSKIHPAMKETVQLETISEAREAFLTIFGKSLEGGMKYEIEVIVTVFGLTPGKAILTFETATPPYGGSCEVHPKSGFALSTEFCIKCVDWVNSEDETDLQYEIYIVEGHWRRELLTNGVNTTQCIDSMKIGTKENFTHVLTYSVLHVGYQEFVTNELIVQVKPFESDSFEEQMELFENYTARVRLQFNQGMHKEAIQTIRSVYEFLTGSMVNNTSGNQTYLIKEKAEQLIDILDYGTAESLGSTLDLAIPEYIAKSVDFILNEPSALTPDSYDKLMDLSDRSTEATRRIISVTHPAPEIVVVAMTPVVESIGKIIKAIENNPTAENETQNVNLESVCFFFFFMIF